MTTLIAVYNSDGCVGRCDAKCYDAIEPECTCVCGGMNHGAGRSKAMGNTQALAEKWIEEYSKQNGLDPKEHRWEIPARDPQQLTLF
jgi:predicted RNase H-like HicB family nuclease